MLKGPGCQTGWIANWVRFHCMRHTFATWHVIAGSTDGDIMAAGGWASAKSIGR